MKMTVQLGSKEQVGITEAEGKHRKQSDKEYSLNKTEEKNQGMMSGQLSLAKLKSCCSSRIQDEVGDEFR